MDFGIVNHFQIRYEDFIRGLIRKSLRKKRQNDRGNEIYDYVGVRRGKNFVINQRKIVFLLLLFTCCYRLFGLTEGWGKGIEVDEGSGLGMVSRGV
jgi:hypothetical protein